MVAGCNPIEREDIRALASAIDDFVDAIEDIGKRLWIYRIDQTTACAHSLVQIIAEQARVLAEAMSLMERAKDADNLKRQVVVINRPENEADDLLNTALASMFDGADDIPALIKAIRWGIAGRIVTAWVVTLPACTFLGWLIYPAIHLVTGAR